MSKRHYNQGINNPNYGKRGSESPAWKGKHNISNNRDYIIMYKPDHPYCDSKGYIPEHRLVLEHYYTILSDYPVFINPKIYDVHHIDGNKKNNNYWNLQLLTKSEHARITIKTRVIKGIKTIKKHNGNTFCLICKSNKTKYSNRGYEMWFKYENGYICRRCYRRTTGKY